MAKANYLSDLLASTSLMEITDDSIAGNEAALKEAMQGGSDAKTLRKLLLDAGFEEKILSEISDEVLLESYRKILEESAAAGQ